MPPPSRIRLLDRTDAARRRCAPPSRGCAIEVGQPAVADPVGRRQSGAVVEDRLHARPPTTVTIWNGAHSQARVGRVGAQRQRQRRQRSPIRVPPSPPAKTLRPSSASRADARPVRVDHQVGDAVRRQDRLVPAGRQVDAVARPSPAAAPARRPAPSTSTSAKSRVCWPTHADRREVGRLAVDLDAGRRAGRSGAAARSRCRGRSRSAGARRSRTAAGRPCATGRTRRRARRRTSSNTSTLGLRPARPSQSSSCS